MRRFLIPVIVITLLLSLHLGRLYSAQPTSAVFTVGERLYSVNNTLRLMDVAPYIKDGRAFLPVRYAAYSLGVPESGVIWDETLKTVTLIKGNRVVQVKLGSTAMLYNGAVIRMDTSPEIKDGRAMLPLRFVAQALGSSVSWDAAARTITLSPTGTEPISPESPPAAGDVEINYQWKYQDKSYQWKIPISREDFDSDLEYYQLKPHPQLNMLYPEHYVETYAADPDDDRIIAAVVKELKQTAEREGFDEYKTVEFVLSFVQGLPYISDSESTPYDEYPRYPMETLLEKCGDCEDTALLAGVLLREMGYGAALIIIEGDPSHAALGVYGGRGVTGSYYRYGGRKYFYVETTASGWPIGQIPDQYQKSPATVIPLP